MLLEDDLSQMEPNGFPIVLSVAFQEAATFHLYGPGHAVRHSRACAPRQASGEHSPICEDRNHLVVSAGCQRRKRGSMSSSAF